MSTAAASPDDSDGARAWRAAAERVLKGAGLETLVTRSPDGLRVEPLYPMGNGRPTWRAGHRAPRIAQPVDHPDREQANAIARDEVEGGADALTLVLEDAPAAHGFGLRIEAVDDLDAVLQDVPLDHVALRFEVGGVMPPAAWTALVALQERPAAGGPPVTVDFGLDPLGVLAVRGAVAAPWPAIATAACAGASTLRAAGFASAVLRADGRPYHAAGATQAQELAAVLATGIAYCRALESSGWALEQARTAVSFALTADADLLFTVAKFRALRRLWARVDSCLGLTPRPVGLHGETAWRMLTLADPMTNLLRGAVGAAGALLGGADSITVLPHTAALGLSDPWARRLARNGPLVLIEEAGLARVADPAAGAGAFDSLTTDLCHAAWRLFQAIEAEGGMAAALGSGSWQDCIGTVRSGDAWPAEGRTIVGTTHFVAADDEPPSVLPLARRAAAAADAAARPLPPRRDAKPYEAAEVAP